MTIAPSRLRLVVALSAFLTLAACGTSVIGSAQIGTAGLMPGSPTPSSQSSLTQQTQPSTESTSAEPEPPVSAPSDTTPPSSPVTTPSPSSDTPITTDEPTPDIDGVVGATGIGDPYYPESGNGGYDVARYSIKLTWEDQTSRIEATTTIDASVTSPEKLGQFSFDFQETLTVSAVSVNGASANYSQLPAKLVITPAIGLAPASDFTVQVTYAGVPSSISHGTSGLGDGGWTVLPNGGVIVAGEPLSASTWFPANEHPLDRASFQVVAYIPQGWKMISNGLPMEDMGAAPAGMTSYGWIEREPMATYLTTLYIDKFSTTTDSTKGGIPIINAFAPGGGESFTDLAGQTADILNFLTTKFGNYPFDSAGGLYVNHSSGFALETQNRPVYANWTDLDTVVHELAHQWYGNDVVIKSWADVCLNECFASYSEWLYREATSGENLDKTYLQTINSIKSDKGSWLLPLVDMGAGNEFSTVYFRGPLALHALRNELGDDLMDDLLIGWIKEKSGGNASFDEWEAYVNDLAGRDLSPFIDAWFRSETVPADEFLYPGDLKP